MRIVYRYDPLKLAGANLGIDPAASGERFRDALQRALEREWPEASVEVAQGAPGCALEGFDDPETAELRVEGLARGVRKAGQWIVYR
jgi:hypothetical protein